MIREFILCIVFTLVLFSSNALAQYDKMKPLTHTFSIVAVDSATRDIGVAVQSHWFSVGSVVSWAEAGVGAVATQSLANVSFGPRGLNLLKEDKAPQEALDELLKDDEGREFRQAAIINSQGEVAVYTGKKCIAEAGHVKGTHFSVQANMMLNDTVWPAMADAFRTSNGSLAERMIIALKAAQQEGGDIRGQQSAALIVVRGKKTGKPWVDRKIELRVEDHPHAVDEIARLLKVHQAYEHMNAGDVAIENNDVQKALQEYAAAQQMFPGNVEMKFWTAVSLANVNKLNQALPLFREVFEQDSNWIELTRRITSNGILQVDTETLDTILSVQSKNPN